MVMIGLEDEMNILADCMSSAGGDSVVDRNTSSASEVDRICQNVFERGFSVREGVLNASQVSDFNARLDQI